MGFVVKVLLSEMLKVGFFFFYEFPARVENPKASAYVDTTQMPPLPGVVLALPQASEQSGHREWWPGRCSASCLVLEFMYKTSVGWWGGLIPVLILLGTSFHTSFSLNEIPKCTGVRSSHPE